MSRLRCPELRRLPKSTKTTAIQWRDQTPGALEPLFTLSVYPSNQLVDPSHPGAALKKAQFPTTLRDDVGIRMLPLGLLLREERQFPSIPILTWKERVQKAKAAGITGKRFAKAPDIKNSDFRPGEQLYPERDYNNTVLRSRNSTPTQYFLDLKLKKAERRVPMSFHVSTSKARMGNFRHQRKRLETRLRAALNLIVTKGAFHDVEKGKIGLNMEDSGRKWVMQGWAYMFYPTTKISQMPYANLIDLLRQLLTKLNAKAIQMENDWLNKSLLADDVVKPRMHGNSGPSKVARNWNLDLKASEPSIIPERRPQSVSKSNDLLPTYESCTSSRLEKSEIKHKPKPKPSDEENLPKQALAGKAPTVWKKELVSGLELLLGPRSKKNSSSKDEP